MPRLGLRFTEKRNGQNTNDRKKGVKFPDRLTQAWKALRPNVFSHATHSSSTSKNKSSNYVVKADDLIYIPTLEQYHSRKVQQENLRKLSKSFIMKHKMDGKRKKSAFGIINENNAKTDAVGKSYVKGVKEHTASVPEPDVLPKKKYGDCHKAPPCDAYPFQHNIESMNTLEEVKKLYRSVPNLNLSIAWEQNLKRPNSILCYRNDIRRNDQFCESSRDALSSSTPHLLLNASPTDSGYRSAPRISPSSPHTLLNHQRSEYSAYQSATYRRRCRHSLERTRGSVVNGKSPEPSFGSHITHYDASNSIFTQTSNVEYGSEKPAFIAPNGGESNQKSKSSAKTRQIRIRINVEVRESRHQVLRKKFHLSDVEIMEVIKRGRCKEYGDIVDDQAVTKLKRCLENTIYLMADEIQRLSQQFIKCRIIDVKTAVKVMFRTSVAECCIKAGMQAISIYALGGSDAFKMSLQRRACLSFNVGHLYKWMIENRISEIILDEIVIFFCAVLECLLEEIILACVTFKLNDGNLTSQTLNKILDGQENARKLFEQTEKRMVLDGDIIYFYFLCVKSTDFRSPKEFAHSCISEECELLSFLEMRQILTDNNSEDCESNLKNCALAFTRNGAKALFYYLNSSKHLSSGVHNCSPEEKLGEWIRISEAYAIHHSATAVDEDDVRQAARVLLNLDCPPRFIDLSINKTLSKTSVNNTETLLRQGIALQLLKSDSEEVVKMTLNHLGPDELHYHNAYGLTPLSEAILIGNNRAADALISLVPTLCNSVPNEQIIENCNDSLIDFIGWTSLTWAIARKNQALTVRLIDASIQVESNTVIKETPLQIATILGQEDIVKKLINSEANPFRTTMSYDFLRSNFRHVGSPSAIALAAIYNHRQILKMILSSGDSLTETNDKLLEETLSLKDFLDRSEGTNVDKICVTSQSEEQQEAFLEAMYYAAEMWNIDIAMDLRKIGVAWNLHTWITCFEAVCAQNYRDYELSLLDDFNSRLADELTSENFFGLATLLFKIVRRECPNATDILQRTATIISFLYQRMHVVQNKTLLKSENYESHQQNRKSVIDLRFVNNPDLADITFLVEKKVFYGHRIVLMNTSDVIRRLLFDKNNQICLENISFQTFNLLMIYLYSGGQYGIISNQPLTQQLELIKAALRFNLSSLKNEAIRSIKILMCRETVTEAFSFAVV
ncbi:unnamed protein product [Thelazia callipaeda]|uniref:BTB domain-containing protein n=1 Tax=Thelazia callipaeda TaxID=103827 RepID=A0A0N5CZ52_THECL|nr:unnamed protein product [Thelazia callipaeda]